MKRARVVSAVSAAMLAAGVAVAPSAHAAEPAAPAARCSTKWGVGPKGALPVTMGAAPITGVRSGRHACFDRVVVNVRGKVANRGIRVDYVPQVRNDGSGDVVPLRGRAKLRVIIGHTTYDQVTGHVTYRPRNHRELVNTRGYRTLRQVALAGSFEGQTTIGVGVARKTPTRVQIVPGNPTKIVLDIAHQR